MSEASKDSTVADLRVRRPGVSLRASRGGPGRPAAGNVATGAAEPLLSDEPLPPDCGLGVRFWGVRGSFPRAGAATLRYGGATPCVEVRCAGRRFIIDAGTGIVPLGKIVSAEAEAAGSPPDVDILLSHLHHDHVMGLPFFLPLLTPGAVVRLHVGNLGGETAEAALDCLFSPPLFPVTLRQLPARVEHNGFKAGELLSVPARGSEPALDISTLLLDHPSGATAYRFDHAGRSLVYVSDVEHCDSGPNAELVRFVKDADIVIYDAMFTEGQFQGCRGWGHSTWRAGVALCEAASARRLVAFHHHPGHDDAMLDAIGADLAAARPGSFVAREGLSVVLAAGAASTSRRATARR